MSLGLTRQRPGELPLEITGFVGRDRELAELAGLLRTARLITVTGPGGVGKTRVALRAAARHSGEFADGTCLVELSGRHDPELLPDTVAASLGLPGTAARSQLDVIIDHVRDQRILLILDTCEHLIDACAMLADILLRATGLTVLATSRQPLAVPGEHTYAIPPLPVPDPRALTAGDGDAVRAVRPVRGRGRARLRRHRRQPGQRDRALPPPGRDPAGHRAGHGAAAGHPARAAGRPAGGPVPAAGRAAAARPGRTTRRCAPRPSGAMTCARRPSSCSGRGWRCSPARSTSRRSSRCARASRWTAGTSWPP